MQTRTARSSAQAMALALSAMAVAGAGCEQEAPIPNHRITVEVYSDMLPLPGVQLTVQNQVKATTDATGVGSFVVQARDGTELAIVPRCPPNTRAPLEPVRVTLRALATLSAEGNARGLIQRVSCPPAERSVAVVVRTDRRPGLPIRQGDREVARTDEQGVAVLTFRARPATTIQLAMDTSSNELLMPQNPTFRFPVPDNDEVQRWEVNFQDAPPPRAPVVHVRSGPTHRSINDLGTGQVHTVPVRPGVLRPMRMR